MTHKAVFTAGRSEAAKHATKSKTKSFQSVIKPGGSRRCSLCIKQLVVVNCLTVSVDKWWISAIMLRSILLVAASLVTANAYLSGYENG